jgi:hypothetical protein
MKWNILYWLSIYGAVTVNLAVTAFVTEMKSLFICYFMATPPVTVLVSLTHALLSCTALNRQLEELITHPLTYWLTHLLAHSPTNVTELNTKNSLTYTPLFCSSWLPARRTGCWLIHCISLCRYISLSESSQIVAGDLGLFDSPSSFLNVPERVVGFDSSSKWDTCRPGDIVPLCSVPMTIQSKVYVSLISGLNQNHWPFKILVIITPNFRR